MTDNPARTDFAAHQGGTGVVIRSRRTDFVDPEIRDADQAQLLRRVSAHVLAGTTDLSDEVLVVEPSVFLDQDRWDADARTVLPTHASTRRL